MAVAADAAPRGLTAADAAAALAAAGPNELPSRPPPTIAERALRQLADPLALLLLGAAAVSAVALRHVAEAAAIAAIVLLNVGLGVAQERRADEAVAALERLAAPSAHVRRGGEVVSIPAREVVPGDVVEVEAGDRVPADVELLVASALAVDESMLTGESLPADKRVAPTPPGTPVAERSGELCSGTLVVRGTGVGVVLRTGAATEMGAIASALGGEAVPPLVRELRRVAVRMTWCALAVGAVVAPVAALRADDVVDGLLAGVALAVAAVPEGLATVVTVGLALGARRLARQGVIVRRLHAIDALGAVDVLCADKTGTLTTGRLALVEAVTSDEHVADLWAASLRCNDALDGTGDPLDLAIVEGARDRGVAAPDGVRVADRPFDPDLRTMATVHRTSAGHALSVKGAPEAVFGRCRPSPLRDLLAARVDDLAAAGLRVVAVAVAATDDPDAGELEPVGLLAFRDPPRSSASGAVAAARRAGVRVVLVTGDHLVTARAIAAAVGLDTDPAWDGAALAALPADERSAALAGAAIVARVDPATKVELVDALRAAGAAVAMTGDGVNDAPALRRADVGVALAGDAGTDVAREAASVVLTDGDIGRLVDGIREGRRVFRNVATVVSYLLAGNLSEVLVVVGAVLLLPELAVPLLPVHLLWVNFVTDGLPSLALAVDRPVDDPMDERPRGAAGALLARPVLLRLLLRAVAVAGAVLATGVAAVAAGWSDGAVRTQLLLSLLASHLLLAYSTRARRLTFERGWWCNRLLAAAIGGSLVAQVAAFGTPLGRSVLSLDALPAAGWLLAAAAAAATAVAIDLGRIVLRRT